LLNCMFYTDDYIDARVNTANMSFFQYTWNYEVLKCFWALLVSYITMPIFYLLSKPSPSQEEEFIGAMKKKNPEDLKDAYKRHVLSLSLRYIMFCGLATSL